ncbi:MAG TPA: carboxylesterase family protein [Steroidobacteraceae bacterium]|jgi:para-nitrobenzyl esterase|nr:carboxylesterase family protein [Steroidobacteraceae bacterium]
MIDRRSFIGTTVAAGALVPGIRNAWAAVAAGPAAAATTTAGKIRGTQESGVFAFKGIPYGATTAGAARFQPPAKAKSWSGVRDCTQLGHRSPQLLSLFHGFVPPEVEAMDRDEPMGEDCLVLNVWTPTLERARELPVMVWLHGGGFTSGSGGFICYDGAQLAKKHDVVVVNVNHRLGPLGYLYLAGLGSAQYANSSNVGNLDIVAALEWVRDNIATFGADPGNVTIFGQSGGGGKVSSLMAMPAAHGLFKRAIVQSGADVKGISRDAATRDAQRLLARLNLKPDQADQLQHVPMDQLLKAANEGSGPPINFGPVVDGKSLPSDPFDPTAPELSGSVPLLIGTVETEVTFFPGQPLEPMDDATFHAKLKQLLRTASDTDVDRVIAAYRGGRPDRANTDLYLIMASDATFRAAVLLEAERKAEQTQAPVYQYYFTWRSPVREGKLRTFHTLEIPFVFDNVDACKSMTGSGEDRYALAQKMSSAWVAFARTGNPNHPTLPDVWVPYDNTRRATMIFNDKCELLNDPYGSEQRLLHSVMGAGRT